MGEYAHRSMVGLRRGGCVPRLHLFCSSAGEAENDRSGISYLPIAATRSGPWFILGQSGSILNLAEKVGIIVLISHRRYGNSDKLNIG